MAQPQTPTASDNAKGSANPHDPFIESIGRLTVNWALAESALDDAIKLIHDNFGGQEIDDEFPVSFKRKIRYFRKAALMDNMTAVRQDMESMADEMIRLADLRKWCVHGVASRSDPLATARLFTKYNYRTGPQLEGRTIALDEIRTVATACHTLGLNLIFFCWVSLEAIPEE